MYNKRHFIFDRSWLTTFAGWTVDPLRVGTSAMSITHPGSRLDPIEAVPVGHVRLVLVRQPLFYLEIPMDIIHSLCLKPRKYLVFLGWCILGVEGMLMKGHGSGRLGLDGVLEDRGLYIFVTDNGTCTGTGTFLLYCIFLYFLARH